MPTYEYRCPDGHDFEKFTQKMSNAQSELPCPNCGKVAARRLSAGGGFVFKGSGFYITDYGKDGKKDQRDAAKADAAKAESTKAESAKGESAKAESSNGESTKVDSAKSDSTSTTSTSPAATSATSTAPAAPSAPASAPANKTPPAAPKSGTDK